MHRPLIHAVLVATFSCGSAPQTHAPPSPSPLPASAPSAVPLSASATASADDRTQAIFAEVKAKNAAEVKSMLDAAPALANARNAKGRSVVLTALFTMKDKEAFLKPQENPCLAALLAKRPSLDGFETAALGDAAALAAAIDRDPAFVKSVHALGWTPLHFAAYGGNVATAELLLSKGALLDVVAKNDFRNTPLQVSLLTGQEGTLALFIARGANVNAKQAHDFTALHEAAQSGDGKLVAMLLDAGADVNAKSDAGATPLDAAVKGKRDSAAALLRARGAKEGTGKLE